MRCRSFARWMLCASLLAAGLASCGDEATTSQISVTAGDGRLELPAELSAGIVTVDASGLPPGLSLDFTRITPGTSHDDFAAAVAVLTQGGAFPDFVENNAGVNTGTTATVKLDPGSYLVWVDPGGEGQDAGPAKSAAELLLTALKVTGDGGGSLPDTDGTFSVDDYDFDVDVEPGSTYTFENRRGDEFHHVIVLDFGTIDADLVREAGLGLLGGLETGEIPPGFESLDPESLFAGGSGVFGPGSSGTFDLELQEGHTYMAVCFIQDRIGGEPHAFSHEMFEVFTT